jgi:PAS domain S-box-containing protein
MSEMPDTSLRAECRVDVARLPLVTYLAPLDAPGCAEWVSPGIETLTGFAAKEWTSRPVLWLERVAPEDRGRFADACDELRRTGRRDAVEYRLQTRSGRAVWVRDHAAVVDGEVHGYLQDVTRERELEAELASELQNRRLIEQLPLVTYTNAIEPMWRATYASPQIEELFGYPPEAFLEDADLGNRAIHPDDYERVRAAGLAARERDGSLELEYRIVRADGTVRWVLDLMDTVRDEEGMPLFEQGFLVDITARKLAEARQRESELQFRAVFDNALDAMMIIDDDGRFVDVNDAACALLGRTREQLLVQRVTDFRTDSARGSVLRELLEAGETTGTMTIRRPDGSERDAEYAAKANVLPGRHVSVLRDVTQRNRLERELWRAQKLESIGRLAGGVAHDFNNMLTAVRGYTHLLLAELAPGSDARAYAEEVERAAERATNLTTQLLAFGRRQTLQPRPLELNALVENLAGMLARLTGEGVAVELALAPALRAVRVDETQLEQVLVNLVLNSAEAMPAGGRVVVRTGNVDVEHDPDAPEGDASRELPGGRYVAVSVEDTGGGMDAATRERLFEPFFTTKAVGRGTGLGLATAYGIARQSGGTITVETQLGKGSTFTVLLPAAEDAGGATVLVVMAARDERERTRDALLAEGFRVLAAADPREAEELAARLEGALDLVVVDGADDAPLVERLRRFSPRLRALQPAEVVGLPETGEAGTIS